MALRSGMLAVALLAVGTTTLWGWRQHQQLAIVEATNQHLQDQRDRALQDRNRHLATTHQLKSELERERDSQAKLLVLQGELRQGLARRERLIEALKHENQQLQDWADQPLPDTARRLRQRPALTGADAYRQWLSAGRPLPAASDHANPQRQPAR